MKEIEKLEGNEIGFPQNSSIWLDEEPDRIKITRLTLTSGGGLGGSKWVEYVERVDKIESNQLQKFRRYDNVKEIIINTAYIVEVEDFDIILATYKTINGKVKYLQHEGIDTKLLSTVKKYGVEHGVKYLTEPDQPVNLVNEFKGRY